MLEPALPVVRNVEIEALTKGLKDGRYVVRMQPKGCRWWHGRVKEGAADEKVPKRLCVGVVPPLIIESGNEVEVSITDGKVEKEVRDAAERGPGYHTEIH